MSDISRKERQQEAALQICGPLQDAANAQWRAKRAAQAGQFLSIEDVMYDHRLIVIPDALRDGLFWSLRLVSQKKGERISEFYDYRYSPSHCGYCDQQYRFPAVRLIRYRAPDEWDALWSCPFGHVHEQHLGDRHIQELLCDASRYRLIEQHG